MNDLIFDVGVGSGQDTYFYLQKGFRVVGIEADPFQCDNLKKLISNKNFILINAIAGSTDIGKADIFIAPIHYLSSVEEKSNTIKLPINCINYKTLIDDYGIPYYCKIDIEGSELDFIKGMQGLEIPEFISVQIEQVDIIDQLYKLGYSSFKLINQCFNQLLYIDYQQNKTLNDVDGRPFNDDFPLWLSKYRSVEWSGLFGKDLTGWYSYDEARNKFALVDNLFKKLSPELLGSYAIFDCHAKLNGRKET